MRGEQPTSMDPDDLSIGYEAWARPGLGLAELLARIEMADPASRSRRLDAQRLSFRKVWERISKLSLLGHAKAYVIYRLAQRALTLPGDFIECGVYQGGLSLMLGLVLEEAESSKRVLLCDTFAGLPAPDRSVDKAYAKGAMVCSPDVVAQSASELGLTSRCILYPGLFTDTFRTLPDNQSFALAHVDCDLYHGTKASLEYVYPRLVDGAPLILDDYYDESHGVMRAVNEFAEAHQLVVHLSVWGQAFLIKGEQAGAVNPLKIGQHGVRVTTETVREEPVFLTYLEEVIKLQENKTRRLREFVQFCRETQ
jgi:O-methyltransferase